jgi:genome maintenance exonuclease 1
LTTENIEGSRYYVLPDGVKLKSVTSTLSEKLDKTALFEWKQRVGEEEANKISVQATRRGTEFHSIAEKYVLNEPDYKKGAMPANVASFMDIQQILDKYVDNIYGVELPLYSKALKAAGRTDLVAEFDGVRSIIDFKTARKTKKKEWIESYFLQSTIYSMMFERLYGIEIPQIAILISVDGDYPQTFVEDRGKYVNRVLEIFT